MSRVVTLSVLSSALFAASDPEPFRHPLVFEPNRGQAPADVQWIGRSPNYQLLLKREGAVMAIADRTDKPSRMKPGAVIPEEVSVRTDSSRPAVSIVEMRLTGGRPWMQIRGLKPTGSFSNYFLGNDPKAWRTDIPHYAEVRAAGVYEGIDLVFYERGGDLEYDFVVSPGADPKQIRLTFDGVDSMRVDDKSGDLVLKATGGGAEIRHRRPRVYQQQGDNRVEVASGYEILDRYQATFTLAAYDSRRSLVIDPTISYFSVLSGNNRDIAMGVAVDPGGNAYVAGRTLSTNFAGSFQRPQGSEDAFVAKLSPTGALLFITYLGGLDFDYANGIAADSTGAYVTGTALSRNFPAQAPLNFPTPAGGNAFITKIVPSGNALLYSTLLGGSDLDEGQSVAVDAEGLAYIVGSTSSIDFPSVGRSWEGGNWDAFLVKLDPQGSTLIQSNRIGGSGVELGWSVAVNANGVFVSGSSGSSDFLPAGPKGCGAFVVHVRYDPGLRKRYGRCLGPNVASRTAVAADASGNAYVTGATYGDFPTTPGAFQTSKPTVDPLSVAAFVVKLNLDGQTVYSTYLGGSNGSTFATAIAVDSLGAVRVGGATTSTRFPGTSQRPNSEAGFIVKVAPQGNALNYTHLLLGAQVYGVQVFRASSRLPVVLPVDVYACGFQFPSYTGGGTPASQDLLVVKLEEELSIAQPR